MIVLLPVTRHDRNEALGERALGEKSPQHVRNAVRDEKGVHDQRGAKEAGQDDVPKQPQDPRDKRHATDNRGPGNELAGG